MAATSVKAVDRMSGGLNFQTVKGTGSMADSGFGQIWNAKTGGQDAKAADNTQKPQTAGSSLKTKTEHLERNSRSKDLLQKTTSTGQNQDENNLENAEEVLSTAVNTVLENTAQILDVSVDELKAAMDTLGMDSLDILDARQLGNLVLEVSQLSDTSQLLTDENLYTQFQQVMDSLGEVMADCSQTLQMEPEQVVETVKLLQTEPVKTVEAEAEPVIAVETLNVTKEEGQPVKTEEPVQVSETVQTVSEEPATTQKIREEAGNRNHDSQAESNTGNGFSMLDSLKETMAEVQQTENLSASQEVDTQDIMRQIMDYMKVQLKPETTSLEMQLHPANLGTLQIQMVTKGGSLTANFITQNEAVKAALESQMVQLQQNFEEQGIKVNSIEVTVQPHAFEQNLEQGRGNNSGQNQPGRGRNRRINLDALQDEAEFGSLTAEEQLAAEMLRAGGNTVDYTA